MEAAKEIIVEFTQRICDLYHDGIGARKAVELLGDHEISSKFVRGIYHQLSANAKKSMRNRVQYYTIGAENYSEYSEVDCWTSRYLLVYNKTSSDPAFHKIEIIDLFNDKSIKIDVKKSAEELNSIIPLKDGLGLLSEEGEANSFISLICLDLHRRSLKKLHTVEYPSTHIGVVVDGADSTRFLLSNEESTRICKIVEKTIIIGKRVEIGFFPHRLYDKCAYHLKWDCQWESGDDILDIKIYNIEEKTKDELRLDVPRDYRIDLDSIGWIRENPFIALTCEDRIYSIGCVNTQISEWYKTFDFYSKCNILDFSSKFPFRSMTRFEEGSLVVLTDQDSSLYKIPFGNPDSLENMAWLSLVKMMKKHDEVKNPYEDARKYLPPNSTINCPFENVE